MAGILLETGDVLAVLKRKKPEQYHAVLTDPPYGLKFLGREWDHGVPSAVVWAEVCRVLKPGAPLLAFGGTRTFHHLAVAIEAGGFEIVDCLMWLYGNGFPKGQDLGKLIDRKKGIVRETGAQYCPPGAEPRERNYAAHDHNSIGYEGDFSGSNRLKTLPGSPEAALWDGYNTTLRPGWEPIILARKPVTGPVCDNVVQYGTGGLNIDGTRITEGRYPVNVLFEAGEPVEMLEAQAPGSSRFFYCGKARKDRCEYNDHPTVKPLYLTQYLAKLILPPTGGRLLVPFAGSGSEMIGARFAGWERVTGIEREPGYVAIALKRLEHFSRYADLEEALAPSSS